MMATSPSFTYTKSFVYSTIDAASDPRKYSPSPIPTTIGLLLRAAMIRSRQPFSMMAMA